MEQATLELVETAPAPAESPAVVCPATVEVDTRKLFAILTQVWKTDPHVLVSSNPAKVLENPAFQMTIAMGKKIVPLIFKEYERDCGSWGLALNCILGFSPVPEEHYGRVVEIQKDWLKWGKANGYL